MLRVQCVTLALVSAISTDALIPEDPVQERIGRRDRDQRHKATDEPSLALWFIILNVRLIARETSIV
jgi:hypothetical protein